jgi:TonB family protein
MALQRTRRPRLRSGGSRCSLGSPLNARPLGGGSLEPPWSSFCVLLLVSSALAGCNTAGSPPASPVPPSSRLQKESEHTVPSWEYCQTKAKAIVGGEVLAPRLVKRVPPDYPTDLLRKRIFGRVVMQGVVTAEGRLEYLEIASSPDSRLSTLALAAARQWLYEPATLRGQPLSVCLAIYFDFFPPR